MAEGYEGVRFMTTLVGEAPTDTRIEELKFWSEVFHTHNLAPPYPGGSYGNLSFRVRPGANNNRFVITTSRTGLNVLAGNCFAEVLGVDLVKGVVYARGVKEPSSESMVHYVIYRERPEVGAVFHGHSPEILAAANALGVPETEREVPYGTLDSVEEILKILDKQDFLVMKTMASCLLARRCKKPGNWQCECFAKQLGRRGFLPRSEFSSSTIIAGATAFTE